MPVSSPDRRHSVSRAVVTGGGQGVGLAIARQLVAEGCRAVALVGRDRAKLETAAADLRAQGATIAAISADVSSVADCERVIATAIAELGGVNVLVNAAATSARGTLTNTDQATFDAIFATNVRGPFFLMQGVVRHALANKAPASMLTILSMAAHGGAANLAAYSASKAAAAVLTRNVATAYRSDRIRCNAILPGWMDTPGEHIVQQKWEGAGADWLAEAEAERPFGQLVKPDQLALLAAYVLSPDAGVMTGSLIDYDQTIVGAL